MGGASPPLTWVKGIKVAAFSGGHCVGRRHLPWVREDSIFDIGLGYPVLRQLLRALGDRLVEAGAIGEADDIYWLDSDEVKDGVLGPWTMAQSGGCEPRGSGFWSAELCGGQRSGRRRLISYLPGAG